MRTSITSLDARRREKARSKSRIQWAVDAEKHARNLRAAADWLEVQAVPEPEMVEMIELLRGFAVQTEMQARVVRGQG